MEALRSTVLAAYRSYRSLPTWVQVWVAWLFSLNVVSVTQLDHPSGRATAAATASFTVPNAALVVRERGFGRSLSIPHLLAFPPLLAFLVRRLGDDDLTDRERRHATTVLVTDAISTVFDVIEVVRWVRGERAVFGAERPGVGR